MQLAIIGSEHFADPNLIKRVLSIKHASTPISMIITGGGMGNVTRMVEEFAEEHKIFKVIFTPGRDLDGPDAIDQEHWQSFGAISKCEEAIAFWDGHSKETLHAIEIAAEQNKKLEMVLISRLLKEKNQ